MIISHKSMLRPLLCTLLGLIFSFLLFSLTSLEGTAARATGTVKNPILNVRTDASTSSSIRCKLTQGVKVTILSETTGTDGMKWYNVYFSKNNEALEGYVRADLVLVAGSTTNSNTTSNNSTNLRAIRPNAAIVRSKPTTSSSILTRLYKGTIISVTSEQTASDNYKWSSVTYMENGVSKEGYIRSDLLTTAPAGATMTGSTSGSASSSSSSGGTKKIINTNVAIVRSYASTNGDIRTRLLEGTQVTIIKTVTGVDDKRTWHKVSYENNGISGEGYIRGDLLSDPTSAGSSTGGTTSNTGSSSTTTNQSALVKPLVANIRSYASTNGDIRSKLSQGTMVTILSEKTGDDNQKWYKISYTYGGTQLQGYIRGDLVTFTSASSGGASTPSTGDTNSSGGSNNSSSSGSNPSGSAVATVYSYASPDADVRASLPNGTKVTIIKEVTGEDGGKWTKIGFQLDGKQVEGYVKSSVLKS